MLTNTTDTMNDDINQKILEEVRKIRRMFYVVLAFVIIGALPAFYGDLSRGVSQAAPSWTRVTTAMQRQDFPAALAMSQVLVAQQPNYSYGHACLGAIYLAMGDVTNAHTHYLRAYELFPNEESEKVLAAVRKRLSESQPFKLLSK